MESLSETTWDVLICGTGLQQSLLALALSRSHKKVLHVDRNGFYGGSDAALSLQEVEEWVRDVQEGKSASFRNASVSAPPDKVTQSGDHDIKLSFSRAYSLSLSPEIIYTRSTLLKTLISSKVYHQLEFLSIGHWWVYAATSELETQNAVGTLRRVPNGREDVFSDKSIDLRSKRVLMNFLRFVADHEKHPEKWKSWATKPIPEFLVSEFDIPEALQSPLLAISMTPDTPNGTTVAYALPHIAQHLRSIGVFGPGFGAITPRWGGSGEICQVACRAGAVGGGVYVLGRGVATIDVSPSTQEDHHYHQIELQGAEKIKARYVVGTRDDLPPAPSCSSVRPKERTSHHSITVVSSSVAALLPITAEGAPPPAGAVVVLPTGSLSAGDLVDASEVPPVYLILHSSDTGECPAGQSVLYASFSVPVNSTASTIDHQSLLKSAVELFLAAVPDEPTPPKVLYTLHYTRPSESSSDASPLQQPQKNSIFLFPSTSTPSLTFDEAVIERVKSLWEQIVRKPNSTETEGTDEEESFMMFDDREGYNPADDDHV